MLEFVGIGDLHLGKLERIIPGIGNEVVVNETKKCLDYALSNGITNVFFYGDIGDKTRLSYKDHLALLSLLLDPKYAGLKFWIILGNHDFDEHGVNSLQIIRYMVKMLKLKNIRIFVKGEDEKIDGVNVRFMPYPLVETSKKAVNIGHFDAVGAKRDNGRTIKNGEGVDTDHFCCVGHLHTPHTVKNMFFSGTLYQTNFGETLPKMFHHVKVLPSLKRKVKYVRNEPAVKLFNLEIYSRKDLNKITKNKNDLYKLFVQDGVKINPDDLSRHKNVIKINRFKDDSDLKVQLEEEWKAVDMEGTVFQPKKDLLSFLKKRNVDKEIVSRTLAINKRILSEFFKGEEGGF